VQPGVYQMFNNNYCYAGDVQVHSHPGATMYVIQGTRDQGDGTEHAIAYGTKPLQAAYYTPGGEAVYSLNGQYYYANQIQKNTYKAYNDPGQQTLNHIVAQDNNIEKSRDFLTGKLNVVKQQAQTQETQMNTTTDAEGMIIQQGMKIASLLETLASQIGQI
jgi:hypothetical protein